MRKLCPQVSDTHINELVAYFTSAFGHGIRVDYGSGHELSFVAWLCCLRILGVLTESDDTATVMRIFPR
jgi:serine/threonine-protein phosphatase 2A activator